MSFLSGSHIVLIIVLIIINYNNVQGNEVADRDLSLTATQKVVLDKFKHAMEPLLEKDYMKKEIYLIRWLRATNFDLEKAQERLLKNLQWREELKMDTVHQEDWSDFQAKYGYRKDFIDKLGQPTVSADFGSWDFRAATVQGDRQKMERYIYKILDDAEVEVRKQQKAGKFVTRGNLLLDLEGYNIIQNACPQCISLYVNLVLGFDTYFPSLFDKMIVVNAPRIFEVLLNTLKPVMTKETREALQVYGTKRSEWQNILLDKFNEDQLPLEYGGLKE